MILRFPTHSSSQILMSLSGSESSAGVLVKDMLLMSQLGFGCASEVIQSEDWVRTLVRMGNESTQVIEDIKDTTKSGGARHIPLVFHQFLGSWREVDVRN